ncbi:MAG: hypothetical protein IKF46_05225 [Erysipelotrichaceae bacterium]|nr:hypothetical protein [Erysipelotrichaceae bacterium]
MIPEILLKICGAFYALLCIFSIVTGLMYASGKRRLNPLELPDSFMLKFNDPDKLKGFTVRMGWLTFFVGIVQGITASAIFSHKGMLDYGIALGFTLFSIASVAFKLRGKISAFALLKSVAYLTILIVLLLKSTRTLFGI